MECRAVCQNDTLQRAALQSCLALNTFHPPSQSVETILRRGQQLRRTNYSTTILRPSASRLSHHLPRSLSLSPSISSRYLPAYNLSSFIVPTTYIILTLLHAAYPTVHFLASLSWPSYSSHFSRLISHPPTRQSLSCLSPSPPLSIHLFLSLSLSSLFLGFSLHCTFSCMSILSPSCLPVTSPILSPLHHRSLLACRRLNRALILSYPQPRSVSSFLAR